MRILHEVVRQTGLGEVARVPGFEKESPRVREDARLNQHDTVERCRRYGEMHSCIMLTSPSGNYQLPTSNSQSSRRLEVGCWELIGRWYLEPGSCVRGRQRTVIRTTFAGTKSFTTVLQANTATSY